MSMPQHEILVCGAGIAGSTLAYWLGWAGHKVTIIERSPAIRNSGIGVDIRGDAIEVVRRMGLEEKIRSLTTDKEGTAFVDAKDRTFAFLGTERDNLERSPSWEISIMRSDLAKLITTTALHGQDQNVKIQYGVSVESMSQDESKVSIGLSNRESATFDLVIAADGLGSATRKLLLGGHQSIEGTIHSLGEYTAYFSIPREDHDGMVWKQYNAPQSRILSIRPKSKTANTSCAYLSIMPEDEDHFREILQKGVAEQKREITKRFADAGRQAPRLLSAMQDADDFYLQHSAQVKFPSWTSGRCAVVGDAAYCPSPGTAQGTSLALIGAYMLAGEIDMSKDDLPGALKAYEEKLRPYVEKKQRL